MFSSLHLVCGSNRMGNHRINPYAHQLYCI